MEVIKVASVSARNWIGEPEKSLKNMAKWAKEAAKQEVDLVVFPELGVNGYVQHDVAWDLAESVPHPVTL